MKDFVKGLAISQVIPQKKLNALIQKWQVDKGVIKLKTERLLQILIFSSVFQNNTLREMSESYGVAKSTLDDALRKRSHGFFSELCTLFLQELIALTPSSKERKNLRELIAIDATILHVHGSMAKKFMATKIEAKTAGLKLHAAWNLDQECIVDLRITGYRRNDGSVGKEFQFAAEKMYVFDRAYVDINLWLQIRKAKAHFVTRLKKMGQRLKYVHTCHVQPEATGVLYDGIWTPSEGTCYENGFKPREVFFRHVIYRDPVSTKLFDFITSDFESNALEIANIYRKRWAVELLFRWMKGHLNIRRFGFKNMNALKILICTAVLVQLIIRYQKLIGQNENTLWECLRTVRTSLCAQFYQTFIQSQSPDERPIYSPPLKAFGD